VLDDQSSPSYQPPSHPSAEELADLRAEAQRAGLQQGLERGRQEGLQALERERSELLARMTATLATLHRLEAELVQRSRGELLDLALLIAARIVRERIDAGDPVASRIAEELIGRVGRSGGRQVRVHPDDLQAITTACAQLADPGSIEVIADPQVDRGGVIVESPQEQLDARIGTQIGIYQDALQELE
jgi:flagellar assembly protein FliH